jgi:hypothetical protein
MGFVQPIWLEIWSKTSMVMLYHCLLLEIFSWLINVYTLSDPWVVITFYFHVLDTLWTFCNTLNNFLIKRNMHRSMQRPGYPHFPKKKASFRNTIPTQHFELPLERSHLRPPWPSIQEACTMACHIIKKHSFPSGKNTQTPLLMQLSSSRPRLSFGPSFIT